MNNCNLKIKNSIGPMHYATCIFRNPSDIYNCNDCYSVMICNKVNIDIQKRLSEFIDIIMIYRRLTRR